MKIIGTILVSFPSIRPCTTHGQLELTRNVSFNLIQPSIVKHMKSENIADSLVKVHNILAKKTPPLFRKLVSKTKIICRIKRDLSVNWLEKVGKLIGKMKFVSEEAVEEPPHSHVHYCLSWTPKLNLNSFPAWFALTISIILLAYLEIILQSN